MIDFFPEGRIPILHGWNRSCNCDSGGIPTIDRIVSMLPEHEIRVANPVKVRLIPESM